MTALAVAGANAPLYYAWVNGNGNLHSRLGALHQNAEQGAWARIFGGKLDGNGFSDKYHTYQVGYDIKAGNWKSVRRMNIRRVMLKAAAAAVRIKSEL